MMDANDLSDECNQEELENALYSQIHFSSHSSDMVQKSNNPRINPRLSNRSQYKVGIQDLPLRVVQASKKMSLSMQDFIAFSDEPESLRIDNNEQETRRESSENTASMSLATGLEIAEAIKDLKNEVLDFVIDRAAEQRIGKYKKYSDSTTKDAEEDKKLNSSKDVKLETDVKKEIVLFSDLSNAGVKIENTVSEVKTEAIHVKHENSDEVLNLLEDDVPEQFMVDDDIINEVDNSTNARNDRKISKSSKKKKTTTSVKVKDNLLPFTITKTASRAIEPSLEKTETKKKQETSRTNASRLKDFLRLPQTFNSEEEEIKLRKKQRISKLDAAVKPMKPPVELRRPAVVVKYREHSDTDTEYSDSDSSEKCQQDEEMPMVATDEKALMEETDQDKALEARDLRKDKEESVDESEEEAGDECSEPSSDSSESESVSDTSLLEDQLDFNLDGGLNALLKPKSEDADKWQINEKDRFNVTTTMSRYFSPRTVTCRNCDAEGHLSRNCPEPVSRRCIFCGKKGHVYQKCPDAICHNCDAPGHRANQCEQPRRDRKEICSRCKMKGHNEEMCPDKLRQFHRTVDPQCLFPRKEKIWKNPRVYCYNCGQRGHLGHVCKASRMNANVIPSSPFVIRYDTSSQYRKKQRILRRKIRKQEKAQREKEIHSQLSHKDKNMWEQSGHYSSRSDCLDDFNYNDRAHQSWSKGHRRSDNDFSREYNDYYESRGNAGGRDCDYSNISDRRRKERKQQRYESAEWRGKKGERISGRDRSKDRGVTVRFESLEFKIPQDNVKTVKRSRKNEKKAYGKPWPPRDDNAQSRGQQEVNEQYSSSGGNIRGSEFQWQAGREDGEILDDDYMEGYQVEDNEWWKEPKSKKRKRRRELESERQTGASPREQQYHRQSYSYKQDYYHRQRTEPGHRDSSFEERQRHQSSSMHTPHKRQDSFDAAFYPEPFGSRHNDPFPFSTYTTPESRKRKHHPQEQSPRDRGSYPPRNHPLLPSPVMFETPPQSSDRQHHSHLRSCSSLKTKRNASGFQSQNSRFIKLSNDYKMSVNIKR